MTQPSREDYDRIYQQVQNEDDYLSNEQRWMSVVGTDKNQAEAMGAVVAIMLESIDASFRVWVRPSQIRPGAYELVVIAHHVSETNLGYKISDYMTKENVLNTIPKLADLQNELFESGDVYSAEHTETMARIAKERGLLPPLPMNT